MPDARLTRAEVSTALRMRQGILRRLHGIRAPA
jgi:hypothetical protein